jgi:repressor LexA
MLGIIAPKRKLMKPNLTARQQDILKMIRSFIEKNGFPPTIYEICAHFRFKPPSCLDHLKALERKGYLERSSKARSIKLKKEGISPRIQSGMSVPIVGEVKAGVPILATENIEGYVSLDPFWAKDKDIFLLRVSGNSMEGAGILDGDLALIRPQKIAEEGEIVVALINDEATLKRFYRGKGKVWLKPESPLHKSIRVKDGCLQLVGKVIGVFRRI